MKKNSKHLHKLHQELWRWCEETGVDKHSWPKWREHRSWAYCFACESAPTKINSLGVKYKDCTYCPITWGPQEKLTDDGLALCQQDGSPYDKWERATLDGDKEKAKKYARIIAGMPWVEKEYEEEDDG